MAMVVKSVNKTRYKLLLLLLKVLPFVMAAIYIIDLVLQFIGIDCIALGYIAHMTVLPWVFMYLASFVFEFCFIHRLPLYFVLIEDLFVIADTYIGFPVSTITIYSIHSIIVGLFIFLILYLHQNDKCCKKSSSKDNR